MLSLHVAAGVWILLGVVVLAAAVMLAKRWYDGRFRGSTAERLTSADLDGVRLGERATLVQFSSAFCASCRATRQVLTQVSQLVDGVTHVDIDAESHLELVRRADIRRTPTVLVLDPRGRIATRASGQPRKQDVLAALGDLE